MANQRKPKKKLFGAKFTSTLSVALVLFVLTLGAVAGLSIAGLTQVIREQFALTIVTSEKADAKFASKLVKELEAAPYAAKVTYISADSAQQIVAAELGESPESFLGFNPFSASVELHFKHRYAEADSVAMIASQLKKKYGANIEEMQYNEQLLNGVNTNLNRVGIFLLGLAVVLLLVSMSLVSNTVRLALHADRFLIGTMRLVGATNWFIRKPFVMGQAWLGLLASVIAMAVVVLVFYLYIGSEPSASTQVLLKIILAPKRVAVVVVGVMVIGMLIPAAAAWRATSRYLYCKTEELYLM
ncbi:MAG: permease-like cell division protein FtsX [Bacteroidales bacterium]|nr:permease-like cell division protein FtsX [Bacteroidales bacterium]